MLQYTQHNNLKKKTNTAIHGKKKTHKIKMPKPKKKKRERERKKEVATLKRSYLT
jgi:hypothetical protein